MFYSVIGVCVLFACGIYLCYISNTYYDRKNQEYKDIISFLYTVKQKIGSSSLKISVILSNLSGYRALAECGFIEDAKKTGIYSSFIKNNAKMVIDKEDKKILLDYFSTMGDNMLPVEIENIDICIHKLEESYKKYKDQLASKKKVNSTVIICITLLCIILIV